MKPETRNLKPETRNLKPETDLSYKISLSNLGLYRLENFVGRQQELALLKSWLGEHPVIAITGVSGVGKSTLATALAVQEAHRFEEGILWIGATGDELFHFYDIVRDIEDVLATGITNQPVDTWGIHVLQRLYGFHRLLIIDEFSRPDATAIQNLVGAISDIEPGGHGSFIFIGRTLPQMLLDLVGEAHLELRGMPETDVVEWIAANETEYPLTADDAPLLFQLTGGHPLLFKMVAYLWHTNWRERLQSHRQITAPTSQYDPTHAIIQTLLDSLWATDPPAVKLMAFCSQASGGISAQALHQLYWRQVGADEPLLPVVQRLIKTGLLSYNPIKNRYLIHPVVRHYLGKFVFDELPAAERRKFQVAFTGYYISQGHRYSTMPPHQWRYVDDDWGNVRKSFNWLLAKLEDATNRPVETELTVLDTADFADLPPQIDETLMLIRDYALSLRGYLQWRHPPEAERWLAGGIIASRHLTDRRSEALLGLALASVAYFLQDYPLSRRWFRRALPYFKEKRDVPHIIEITKSLGIVLRAMDDLDGALEMYHQALELAETNHDLPNQSALATLIGSLWYYRKNYRQAMMWYHRALAIDEARDDVAWQAVQHNNIGLVAEAQGEYDQAITHYRHAEALHRHADNSAGLSTTFGNLGACYYALNQPHKALECYARDMELQEQRGNWLDMAAILHNMGHIALELDDLAAAEDYFSASRDLYTRFGQPDLAQEEQLLLDTIHDRRVRHK